MTSEKHAESGCFVGAPCSDKTSEINYEIDTVLAKVKNI